MKLLNGESRRKRFYPMRFYDGMFEMQKRNKMLSPDCSYNQNDYVEV